MISAHGIKERKGERKRRGGECVSYTKQIGIYCFFVSCPIWNAKIEKKKRGVSEKEKRFRRRERKKKGGGKKGRMSYIGEVTL